MAHIFDTLGSLSDQSLIIGAVVGFLVYIIWLHTLFKRLRPRLATWLSRKLNVTIEDSLVSGSWQITHGGTWWKGLLLFVVEMAVIIGGAFIPLVVVGLLIFT